MLRSNLLCVDNEETIFWPCGKKIIIIGFWFNCHFPISKFHGLWFASECSLVGSVVFECFFFCFQLQIFLENPIVWSPCDWKGSNSYENGLKCILGLQGSNYFQILERNDFQGRVGKFKRYKSTFNGMEANHPSTDYSLRSWSHIGTKK